MLSMVKILTIINDELQARKKLLNKLFCTVWLSGWNGRSCSTPLNFCFAYLILEFVFH